MKAVGRVAASTNYRYSLAGDLVESESAGAVTRFEYDAAHRLTARITPSGLREDYVRDRAGNLLEMPGLGGVRLLEGNRLESANGEVFSYDIRNHVAARKQGGRQTHYEYDSKDMLVAATIAR